MTKCDLSPFSAHADFEKALANAARFQFPNALIIGCLFHFKQNFHVATEMMPLSF